MTVPKLRHAFLLPFLACGAMMDDAAAALAPKAYAVEFSFQANGADLVAGRYPVHGMEERSVDRPPGSKPDKAKLYRLSPFPIRYHEAIKRKDIHFRIFPAPQTECTLMVSARLTSDPSAFRRWIESGIPADWTRSDSGDMETGLRKWSADLAGEPAKPFLLEMTRTSRARQSVRSETYALTEGFPVLIKIPVSGREETDRISFSMPGMRLWLDLDPPPAAGFTWPRETAAAKGN